ncbi:MAG: PrpF domain-containing protein [Anaerolineae bacterium]
MPQQRRIRCVLMRGGTSKGLYLMRNELPKDPALRDKVILAMYGSPDIRQIDGIGGADALTSKLAIIGPPTREDADVDYTFGQVSITAPFVDYAGNCGNISSGVGPFAIDEGLVSATEPTTTVRIHQTNTQRIIVAQVPVHEGKAAVAGDYRIDGVPGTGARIGLDFSDTAGAVTGQILPTGNARDVFEVEGVGQVEVSIVDAGNPVVFLRASRLGLQGTESPPEIDADHELLDSIERVRGHAAQLMTMVGEWREAAERSPYVPFIALVEPAQGYLSFSTGEAVSASQVDFVSRLLFMLKMHKAYPITGTVCTGAAAMIPGTIVHEVASPSTQAHAVRIGHPSGVVDVEAEVEMGSSGPILRRASVGRTARRIMEGYIFVPEHIYFE